MRNAREGYDILARASHPPSPRQGDPMISSLPRPPHRLERLQHWMAAEGLDCTIVLGADNVNHLCGYWRYFGGPSALVVGARR